MRSWRQWAKHNIICHHYFTFSLLFSHKQSYRAYQSLIFIYFIFLKKSNEEKIDAVLHHTHTHTQRNLVDLLVTQSFDDWMWCWLHIYVTWFCCHFCLFGKIPNVVRCVPKNCYNKTVLSKMKKSLAEARKWL